MEFIIIVSSVEPILVKYNSPILFIIINDSIYIIIIIFLYLYKLAMLYNIILYCGIMNVISFLLSLLLNLVYKNTKYGKYYELLTSNEC